MILQKNDYNSKEVVFIGNSITDLKGVQESGIRFIGRVADTGNTSFAGMDVKVIKDMDDLEEAIQGF